MSRFSKKQKTFAGVATAVVLVAGGGAAYAFWTDSGSDTGTAATGTSTPWTVAVTPDVGNSPLTPGGVTDGYSVKITNAGSGNQAVGTVVVTIDAPSGTGSDLTKPLCTSADYDTTAVSGFSTTSLAPTAFTTGAFTISLKNLATNQDNCKGATANFHVNVN